MRTELHFLYTDATPEIMSCEPSYHIGLREWVGGGGGGGGQDAGSYIIIVLYYSHVQVHVYNLL